MGGRFALEIRRSINRAAQMLAPDTKIFFIGFNKTATISFHKLMRKHRIRSGHWTETDRSDAPNLAAEIDRRLDDKQALKSYMHRWTALSDLSGGLPGGPVEGNRHFRLFDQLFPRSFFILNDRDTDDWIKSRIAHEGGWLVTDCSQRLGVPNDAVPAIWRQQKEDHVAAVLAYFRGRERFLHLRIDQCGAERLADLLTPTFSIDPRLWPHENKTIRNTGSLAA